MLQNFGVIQSRGVFYDFRESGEVEVFEEDVADNVNADVLHSLDVRILDKRKISDNLRDDYRGFLEILDSIFVEMPIEVVQLISIPARELKE